LAIDGGTFRGPTIASRYLFQHGKRAGSDNRQIQDQ